MFTSTRHGQVLETKRKILITNSYHSLNEKKEIRSVYFGEILLVPFKCINHVSKQWLYSMISKSSALITSVSKSFCLKCFTGYSYFQLESCLHQWQLAGPDAENTVKYHSWPSCWPEAPFELVHWAMSTLSFPALHQRGGQSVCKVMGEPGQLLLLVCEANR